MAALRGLNWVVLHWLQTRMMAQKKAPEGIQYSGFFDALLKIPRQEGFLALYKVSVFP